MGNRQTKVYAGKSCWLVSLVAIWCGFNLFFKGSSSVAFAQLVAVPAELRSVRDQLVVPGQVEPAESSDVIVGRNMVIDRFLVVPGQNVKKGQKLAEIDVKSVAYELSYVRPYRDYTARSILVSEIDLKVAQERLSRLSILAKKGIVSDSDLDNAKETANRASRSYEQALAQLANWEAKLADVERRIRDVALVAPQNGIVAEMAIDPRNLVGVYQARAGTVVARIETPGKYRLDLKLTDRDFLRLEEFPICEVLLPHSRPIKCSVIPPDGVPERSEHSVSARFPVSVKFDYTPGPGGVKSLVRRAEAVLKLSAAKSFQRLLLPWNAVQVDSGKTFVRKIGAPRNQRTEVKLGWRDGYYVEVLDGLKSGEMVEAQVWPPAARTAL